MSRTGEWKISAISGRVGIYVKELSKLQKDP